MKTFLNGLHSVQNALDHDAENITQLWVAENKRNPRIDKRSRKAMQPYLQDHRPNYQIDG